MTKSTIPVVAALAAVAPVQMHAEVNHEAVANIQNAINQAKKDIEGATHQCDYDDAEKHFDADIISAAIDALDAINKDLADAGTAAGDNFNPDDSATGEWMTRIAQVIADADTAQEAKDKKAADAAKYAEQSTALENLKTNWTKAQATANAYDPKLADSFAKDALATEAAAVQAAIDAIVLAEEDAFDNNDAVVAVIDAAQDLIDAYAANALTAYNEFNKYKTISDAIDGKTGAQKAYTDALGALVDALGSGDPVYSKAQKELADQLKIIKTQRDDNDKYNDTGKSEADLKTVNDAKAAIEAIKAKYLADKTTQTNALNAIATQVDEEDDFTAVVNAAVALNAQSQEATEYINEHYAAQDLNEAAVAKTISDNQAANEKLKATYDEAVAWAAEITAAKQYNDSLINVVGDSLDFAKEVVGKLQKQACTYVDEYVALTQFFNTVDTLEKTIYTLQPVAGAKPSLLAEYAAALLTDQAAAEKTESAVLNIDWDKEALETRIGKLMKDTKDAYNLYVQAAGIINVLETKYNKVDTDIQALEAAGVIAGNFEYTPDTNLREELSGMDPETPAGIRAEINAIEAALKAILDVENAYYTEDEGEVRDQHHLALLKGIPFADWTKINTELDELASKMDAENHKYQQSRLKYLVDREQQLVEIKLNEMNTMKDALVLIENTAEYKECQSLCPKDTVHACFIGADTLYHGLTDSIASIVKAWELYPGEKTTDIEKYNEKQLDYLVDLLARINEVIKTPDGLMAKYNDALAAAKAAIAADNAKYKEYKDKLTKAKTGYTALIAALKNAKNYAAEVQALHAENIFNEDKTLKFASIDSIAKANAALIDSLEAAHAMHEVVAKNQVLAEMLTALGTNYSALKDEMDKDQKNWIALGKLNDLLKAAIKVYNTVEPLAEKNEWVDPIKAKLAAEKAKLDQYGTDLAAPFTCTSAWDANFNTINADLEAIKTALNALDGEDKANKAAYKDANDKIDELMQYWEDQNAWINTQDAWEHIDTLAAANEEMVKIRLEIKKLQEEATNLYNANTAANIAQADKREELHNAIDEVVRSLVNKYIAAVDKDNAERWKYFLQRIGDSETGVYDASSDEYTGTIEMFNEAIEVADRLRALDALSESAKQIAAKAVEMHDKIYGYSQQIRDLRQKAQEEHKAASLEAMVAAKQPILYDVDSLNAKAADELTETIKTQLDEFYATVDELALIVAREEGGKAGQRIDEAYTKIDALECSEEDAEVRETLLVDVEKFVIAESNKLATAEHPSEVLSDYIDALNGEKSTVDAMIKAALNEAAYMDYNVFYTDLSEAINKALEDITDCTALTEEQAESALNSVLAVAGNPMTAAAESDLEEANILATGYYNAKTLYDHLDELKNFKTVPSIKETLAQIVADAKTLNKQNIDAALNQGAHDRMIAAVDAIVAKAQAAIAEINENCPDVADDYVNYLQHMIDSEESWKANIEAATEAAAASEMEATYGGLKDKDADNAENWNEGIYSNYYNNVVNALASAKAAEAEFVANKLANIDKDIMDLEELYNKIANIDWTAGEPATYKAIIDEIKADRKTINIGDGVDADENALMADLEDRIAKANTLLNDVLNEGTSAAAYAELKELVDAAAALKGATYEDERVNTDAVAAAEALVDAAAAAVEASKEAGRITYDKADLASQIADAKTALETAIANADADAAAWAHSDEVYNANYTAIAGVQASLDEAKAIIAGLEDVKNDYNTEIDNFQTWIDDANADNDNYVKTDKDYNFDYAAERMSVAQIEAIDAMVKNARDAQAEYDNAHAYDRLKEAFESETVVEKTQHIGLYIQMQALGELVTKWTSRLGIEEGTELATLWQGAIDEFNMSLDDIYESYCAEMADDNEADLWDGIAGVQAKIDAFSKALNDAIDDWKAMYSYRKGDVNRDGDIDILDYGKVASWILNGMDTKDAFDKPADFILADANQSGELNASDLTYIVNEIKKFYKTGEYTEAIQDAMDARRVNNDVVTIATENNTIAVGLQNERAYVGFQMDITLPAGASIDEIELTGRANGHTVAYNHLGGDKYRVLVLGVNAGEFNGNNGALINIATNNLHGTVAISNIHFTNVLAEDFKLQLSAEATAIQGVEAQQSMTEKIYSVGGQLMNGMKKGINIIKGAKILNK